MSADPPRYTAADIQVVAGMALLRRRPAMFLPGGRYSPEDVASRLVHAALLLGARQLVVERVGAGESWWVVRSGTDWLPPGDPLAPLRRATPFPEAGPNSMRPEILPTAYAARVVTATADGAEVIKGATDSEMESHLESVRRAGALGRLIAFGGEDPLDAS